MFALYINDGGKRRRFVDLILAGYKTVETRSPHGARLIDKNIKVGDRVGIISNQHIVGFVTILDKVYYTNKDEFMADEYRHHCHPQDGKYNFESRCGKDGYVVGYVLGNVIRFDTHCIRVSREGRQPVGHIDMGLLTYHFR